MFPIRSVDACARTLVSDVGYDDAAFNIEFFVDEETGQTWILAVNTRISQEHSHLLHWVDGATNLQVMAQVALGERPHLTAETRYADASPPSSSSADGRTELSYAYPMPTGSPKSNATMHRVSSKSSWSRDYAYRTYGIKSAQLYRGLCSPRWTRCRTSQGTLRGCCRPAGNTFRSALLRSATAPLARQAHVQRSISTDR